MSNESIYHYITRMADQNPGLPYPFQNAVLAGSREVKFLLWEDNLPFSIKEELALKLMNQLVTSLDTGTNALKETLTEAPMFLYLTKLTSHIKLYLSEKLIDEQQLYNLGIKLSTKSIDEEEVKLGIVILGFFENDITRQIIKTLGMHSSLTVYALEASKNFQRPNEFVYELAKNTSGYGKLISLYLLEPIENSQKLWVLNQGAKNHILTGVSAILCLEKVDMALFYQESLITEVTFSKFSYLFAYAFESNDFMEFSQSHMLINKYINVAKELSCSFIDLAALVVIENCIVHVSNTENKNGWSMENKNQVKYICNEILKQHKWVNIAMNELNKSEHQTSIIMKVLEKLRMTPDFYYFIPILQRDLFNMGIMKYMIIDHYEKYLEEVYRYLETVLPAEIFHSGPKDIKDKDISSKHIPDIWLMYLLKAMTMEKINDEPFFIRCLTERFPDVRREAIHALRIFKPNWSENVLSALEMASRNEPVRNIKKQLIRLMER